MQQPFNNVVLDPAIEERLRALRCRYYTLMVINLMLAAMCFSFMSQGYGYFWAVLGIFNLISAAMLPVRSVLSGEGS
jgi:hypothetical protein